MINEEFKSFMQLIEDTAEKHGVIVALVAYELCCGNESGEEWEGSDDYIYRDIRFAKNHLCDIPFMVTLANAERGHEIAAGNLALKQLSKWKDMEGRWQEHAR